MQRDLQQLPYNLPCSVRLCRKSSIFITTSPSRRSFVLRHFTCNSPICVTTNQSEMERGMSNRNAGNPPLIEKVLAGSCLVTVGVYALSSAFTLTRIIHERFCCNRRSAAATGLRPAGSPLRPSPYCTSTHRVLRAPRAGLATRLSDFATNRHE